MSEDNLAIVWKLRSVRVRWEAFPYEPMWICEEVVKLGKLSKGTRVGGRARLKDDIWEFFVVDAAWEQRRPQRYMIEASGYTYQVNPEVLDECSDNFQQRRADRRIS